MSRSATPPGGIARRLALLAAAAVPVAIAAPAGAALAADPVPADDPANQVVAEARPAIDLGITTPTVPPFEIVPGVLPGPGDLTTPDPVECGEYDAGHFDVAVSRYDEERIEVQLSYTDVDVCEFAVWVSFWDADDLPAGAAWSDVLGLDVVAAATDSAGSYQLTIDDRDFCNWEVRVAVEEGLPVSYPGTEDCPSEPAAPPTTEPADPPAPVEPPAADPQPEPTDPADPPAPVDPSDPSADPDPADVHPAAAVDPSEPADPVAPAAASSPAAPTPASPGSVDGASAFDPAGSSRGGGGTDGTKLLLGLGFLTLGFGSVVALLTRPRNQLPAT